MSLFENALLSAIQKSHPQDSRLLVMGCGGGYDFFCGIPIWIALREVYGVENVEIGNLTFTDSPGHCDPKPDSFDDILWGIDASKHKCCSPSHADYFPEHRFSTWTLAEFGTASVVWTLEKTGVQPAVEALTQFVKERNIGTVILVDGGTDSLMFGDEEELGTPVEDSLSLLAWQRVAARADSPLAAVQLAAIGWGVDAFHGVSNQLVLENTAALARAGALHGAFALCAAQRGAAAFERALAACQPQNSIVACSLASALRGAHGDAHHRATEARTRGSPLFINALMTLYWCFDACAVAARLAYGERAAASRSIAEHAALIEQWRADNLFDEQRRFVGRRKYANPH